MTILLLGLIYLLFISLGLPDALLGASWPMIHTDLNVPLSYGGIVSFVIAIGTILSSFLSDPLMRRFKTKWICLFSVLLTVIGLYGFYFSSQFWMIIVFSIPLGLGAGAIDAALNNYVATHYETRHMSWLHSMWGVGASIGPYLLGITITDKNAWNNGYMVVAIIQSVVLVISCILLPLWDKVNKENKEEVEQTKHSVKGLFKIKGVFAIILASFMYVSLEQTAILWGSSYLVVNNNITEELAAMFAPLLIIGLTLSRTINGFASYKLNDTLLIRISSLLILIGITLMFIPCNITTFIGLGLIGFGSGPIYPCLVHTVPIRFGSNNSQAIIGTQIGFSYIGICLTPAIFGFLIDYLKMSFLPIFLLIFLVGFIVLHEVTIKKTIAC